MSTEPLEKGLAIAGFGILTLFGVGMGGIHLHGLIIGLVVLALIGGLILVL